MSVINQWEKDKCSNDIACKLSEKMENMMMKKRKKMNLNLAQLEGIVSRKQNVLAVDEKFSFFLGEKF